MKQERKKRGILAGVGALATAAALALGGATAATAAPTTIPNPNATVNLNITKLTTPTGASGTPTGKAQAVPAGSTPISGVTFSVQKFTNIDLSTNSGWNTASTITVNAAGVPSGGGVPADLTLGTATNGYTDATGVPRVTGPDGVAGTGALAFQGMPIGLYLVKETYTPEGVTPAVPFVVALPMTDPTVLNEWMYSVYVYPKNSKVGITKTVNDTAAWETAGTNNIVWTVEADVPRIVDSAATTNPASPVYKAPEGFVITDQLDNRLNLSAVSVAAVDSGGTVIVGLNAIAPADFTLVPATLPAAGANVSVTMSTTGLTKLKNLAATAGNKIRVTLTTQALTGTSTNIVTNGVVKNAATVNVTSNSQTKSISTTPADPETRFGNITFTKKDSAGNLAGATFSLFKSKAEANSNTNPLATTSTSAVTTGAVALNAIRVSDYENGAGLSQAAYRVYWLTETQAPAGYELLAQPLPVVLLSDGTVHEVTVDNAGVVTAVGAILADVTNVKKNAGFVLPLTGGTGTLFLTIGGLAILAIVLIVARRRRDDKVAAE